MGKDGCRADAKTSKLESRRNRALIAPCGYGATAGFAETPSRNRFFVYFRTVESLETAAAQLSKEGKKAMAEDIRSGIGRKLQDGAGLSMSEAALVKSEGAKCLASEWVAGERQAEQVRQQAKNSLTPEKQKAMRIQSARVADRTMKAIVSLCMQSLERALGKEKFLNLSVFIFGNR